MQRLFADGVRLDVSLAIASTMWQRLKGLLGYRSLDVKNGLLITPCNSVHTIGMKFPIDVVFVNRYNRVVKIETNMAPNRFSGCFFSHEVIELASGEASRLGLKLGMQINLRSES
jgi:uncharacterized protein